MVTQTSQSMRENDLFMRNSYDGCGRWEISLVKKQDIPMDDLDLISCADAKLHESGRNTVAYTYETVNKIGGIKVLKGLNGKHGLPEESHSSSSYIVRNQNQTVRQIRLYNSDLTAKTDLEFSVHQGKLLLHAHDYIDGIRQPARELTEKEHELYDKFFGGRT